MIDRIVVPLDRSALSEIAIPYATALARMVDACVEYLTVISEHEDLDTDSANQYLLEIAVRCPASARCRIVVRIGSAAEAIVDQADDPGAMIVIATRCRSGLQRMLLGNVADVVVRTATDPVALIRGGVEAGAILASFRHILVPLDGSDRSATALPLAIELARGSGAHLHLLQVILPVPVSEISYATDTSFLDPEVYADMMADLERSADDDLERARHTCERAGVRATTHVQVGTPSDGILHVAEDVAADLIVMASRGRGGWSRAASLPDLFSAAAFC